MKNAPNKKEAADASPEEYDVLPDDLLQDIARLKGHAALEQAVPVAASILYPVTAAFAAEEQKKKEALRKAEEEALKNTRPGQELPGHGILIGTWQPMGISEKFNVFAAKTDLTNKPGKKITCTYNEAVGRISKLKNWHGFDGTNYANDKELYQALKDGSYDGGWFIPPRELLAGTEADGLPGYRKGIIVQTDNLYDHKDKNALRGSFCKESAVRGFALPDCYWSSTENTESTERLVRSQCVWIANFLTCDEALSTKNSHRMSCRPVRLEPVR